jgi:FixJ family two-component response regulator
LTGEGEFGDNVANSAAKIGLVDDDLSVRRAVDRLLRSHGFRCKTYGSAETALADPELRTMDCLVLDLQLPGLSGTELRDRLRGTGSQVPCLFITAHPASSESDWAQIMGDSPFLIKPFEERSLISSIERLTGAAC